MCSLCAMVTGVKAAPGIACRSALKKLSPRSHYTHEQQKTSRDTAYLPVRRSSFQNYSLWWWLTKRVSSRGSTSRAVLLQSQPGWFLKAALPSVMGSQEACSWLVEPRVQHTSHHSTKSRLGGKVGMTTIYKRLKSIHTSGSKGILFRALEYRARVHSTSALSSGLPLLPKLSASWAACYSQGAFQNCPIAVLP